MLQTVTGAIAVYEGQVWVGSSEPTRVSKFSALLSHQLEIHALLISSKRSHTKEMSPRQLMELQGILRNFPGNEP